MSNQQRIEELKQAIARQRDSMQYADGPAYREEARRLSNLQQELAKLEQEVQA